MKVDREYVSSVTLVVLGDDLDPDAVSKELQLKPSQAWRAGEWKGYTRRDGSKVVFDSQHGGGWKLWGDPALRDSPLEDQLSAWCDLLVGHIAAIDGFKSKGWYCALDLFLTTEATASVVISEDLLRAMASLGVGLDVSLWAGTGGSEAQAADGEHRSRPPHRDERQSDGPADEDT